MNHDDIEALFDRRRTKARRHRVDCFFWHHARAPAIALLANLERRVEEHRFRLTAGHLGELYVRATLLTREIGGVEDRERPLQLETAAQNIPDRCENVAMDRLIRPIVDEQMTNLVRGDDGDSLLARPG
jgi:hypothetical protein